MPRKFRLPSRTSRLLLGAGVISLLGVAACAASVDERASREDEAAAQELVSSARERYRDPVRVVISAVREHGSLTPQQARQLTVITNELTEERVSRRQVREQMRASAVNVVRSGNARTAQFDESVDEAVRTAEARLVQSANALEEVHALLEPEQRKAVGTALRAQVEERFAQRRGSKRMREGFDRAAAYLMLSTFQVDKLKEMQKELFGETERLRPSRAEVLALVDAFEGEDFRSALDGLRVSKTALLRKRIARASERTETALTLLTAEQRDLLADMIQEGPRKVLFGESTPTESADCH